MSNTFKKGVIIILSFLLIAIPTVFAQLSCGDIITTDTTLTGDLLSCDGSDGIIINTSDITLDCNGHKIASGAHNNNGIVLGELADRVVIQNCEIIKFATGIGDKNNQNNCERNTTGIVIRDTFFHNNTLGMDLSPSCGSQSVFHNNITIKDSNFSNIDYPFELAAEVCNLDNLDFTCAGDVGSGDCQSAASLDNIANCTINDLRTTNAHAAGLQISGGLFILEGVNNVINNSFFNVSIDGGDPLAVDIANQVDLIIMNTEAVSDTSTAPNGAFAFAIIRDDSNVSATDVKYPYGAEFIDGGKFKRFWRTNISTDVDNVDITTTSKLNKKITGKTNNNGILKLTLLEYEYNGSSTLVNSTPYTLDAAKGSRRLQKLFSIGNAIKNSILLAVDMPEVSSTKTNKNTLSVGKKINIIANVTDDFFVDIVLVEINGTNYTLDRDFSNDNLIFDNFESGILSSNWSTSGSGNVWTVDSTNPFEGTFHIRAEPRDLGGSIIETNISTIGFTNIDISFYADTTGLDSADTFQIDWNNGTDWINLITTFDEAADEFEGIVGYRFFGLSLPDTASNKDNISLRFVCKAGGINEVCDVDNVKIIKSVQPQKIFSDDLESGALSSNWSTSGSGNAWTVDTTDPFDGTFHLRVEPRDLGGSIIETNISTIGFTDIDISFYAKTPKLDPGDDFQVDWYNGNEWINLITTNDEAEGEFEGVTGYRFFGLSLNNSADNEDNVSIRFVCKAGGIGEVCDVDNISIRKVPFGDLWNIDFNTSGLGVGTQNYIIYANDSKGNSATPIQSNFTLTDPESANVTISSSGGIVNTSSGTAAADIPSGALTDETNISIEGTNATPTTNISSFRIQTDLENVSLIYSFGPEGTNFSVPVTITLKYDDAGVDETTIDIYFYNIAIELWEAQGATCNTVLNECTLNVTHFSDFILGAKLVEFSDADGDGIRDIADICSGSVMDDIELNPNQYAQNVGFGFFEIGPDNHQSEVYDMSTTYGCTCTQIVAQLGEGSGLGKGHLKKGCSPGIMQTWTGINQQPDRE